MAAAPEEPRSPVVANLVVIAGFVAVFASFAVPGPALWILGLLLVVAGGVWAGAVGRVTDEALVPDAVAGPQADPVDAHDPATDDGTPAVHDTAPAEQRPGGAA